MKPQAVKNDIVQKLQKEILSLQGFRAPSDGQRARFGLGAIDAAFPESTFPTGAVHEFFSTAREDAAATAGFMAGLLGKVMHQKGICLWISTNRTVFPPALKFFGVEPDRVIFIDIKKEKDLLWAIEEALKCDALAAVVGELKEITLTESRRLQLAVEHSRVTGFLHRYNPRNANTLACVSRWKITPIPSQLEPCMPGVGHPRWNVQLVKVRNGEPGEWQLEWSDGEFKHLGKEVVVMQDKDLRQTG
ncbi:ImuA family protein [Dyadobacter arcticus]|uniref:Protein ImuA n=1 Tax=Dyadobacter arcticus TaxID=1078754 RepID=A0ABX0UII2_9BACT|nr:Error-prone repair protein ImuA [Dyadobacter arcticus]NIJ52823.1 protein ImuA [Dyadobacter arcticus]